MICLSFIRRRLSYAAFLVAAMMALPLAELHAQEQQQPVSKAQQESAAEAKARAEAEAKAKAEAAAQERAAFFTQLEGKVQALRESEAKLAQQRIAEARKELQDQQRREREQVDRRNRAEDRSHALDKQWENNEKRIKEMTALLEQRQGNLGELFGVTRQVAGDAAGTLQNSFLSVRFAPRKGEEERSEFMRRIAGAKALPSIGELERVWFELQREMTAQGQVVRMTAPIAQSDGSTRDGEVVTVGPFTAFSGGHFLGYLPNSKVFTVLDGQLAPNFRSIQERLDQAQDGQGYVKAVVDPARGSLITRYIERPNVIQRIENGEVVGYVIIAVGIIGLLLALFQYGYLIRTRLAVTRQLRHLNAPAGNNPLGRLVLAFRNISEKNEKPELAELRLSEAVLREVPSLQRFQSFLRLAVAAGPLLGLIGTVIGMIITFHAIVASGASDPKLMAHGIGQAMIATVLGLGVAIPLLFINSVLSGMSRNIIHVLDEQSDALLAQRILQIRGDVAPGSTPAPAS